MTYYDETKGEIQAFISDSNFKDALHLINNELKMPYVPSEFKDYLEQTLYDIEALLKLETVPSTLSVEVLLEQLFKDDLLQLQAVNGLLNHNLREHTEIIQSFFDSTPNIHAQCLLVDGLIRQEINHEFTLELKKQIITFNPRYIELVEESDGYVEALKYLSDTFENDQPSLFMLAKDTLISECYLNYPLNFSFDEGKLLADSIALYIYRLFNQEDGIETFITKNKIESKHLIELFSVMIAI